jgi:uncharacterized protein YbjT (DUF2867 family)
MKLLLVGSTGLVGRHVLELALADAAIDSVVAPSRRAPQSGHPKLFAPIVSFEDLPEEAAWWQADAVICTLGTTMQAAGSRFEFRRVDHDYPLLVARLARRHGTPTFVLNSAIGANASSRFFYNRVKGELERDLADLDFQALTYVRPGLIGGQRKEFRRGERAALFCVRLLEPVLPQRWRINPADRIASKLIEAAMVPTSGVRIVTSDELV